MLVLRQWNQRFWANWDNYNGNGLAFLFIGGEAEASPGWLNYGAWYEWAQMHGAAMFVLEHRSDTGRFYVTVFYACEYRVIH